MTRVGPKMLDSDNLEGALKAVRDGIADGLGLSDDADGGVIEWRRSEQEKSKTHKGVSIEIEVLE